MKILQIRSIQAKIALWASCCLIVSGMVIVFYAVTTSRETAIGAAEERTLAEARIQAGIVKAEIEIGLDTARARAHELAAVKQPNDPLIISREQVNAMMRQVLLQNPQYVGVWTLWEPNAFDGRDADYANTEAYGATGRYFPYWNRGTGTITVEPIVDFDTGDWYQVPKKTGKEYVTNIYPYPVMGRATWMISVVAPIVVNGVFHGVAGEDIPVAYLQEMADRVNIYEGTGRLFLLGSDGRVAAATGRPELRGKTISEAISPRHAREHLAAVLAGKEHLTMTRDHLEAIVPIYFGQIARPWAALVIVPADRIMAPANTLMWRLLGVSLVMILAGVAALWQLAGQIALPIRQVAAMARRVATGDLNQTLRLGARSDELGVLAQDFNNMTQQLRGLYTTLERRLTELKQASEALGKSERKFRVIFDQTFQLIGLLHLDGTIVEVNQTALQFSGLEGENLIGRPFWETPWWSHSPALQEKVRASIEQAARGEFVRFEATHPAADGSLRSIDYSIKPVLDEAGHVTMLIPEGRDITDYKKLEEQLRQAQKMEAIGTLAGGIAHDFNNILGVILGNAEMAKWKVEHGADFAGELDDVIKASHRATELVKQILAFSRQSHAQRIPLQLANVVREVMKILRPSIPSTIEIHQEIAESTSQVLADPTHIHQILMNLCTNAFHAMEDTGGRIDISLRDVELGGEDLADEPDLKPGRFVRLSVADSGPGIAPEVQDRIFDPYFTTKEVGKGTGMGLSIVHGIVSNSGGFLTFASELGKGTVFDVFLPAVEEVAGHDEHNGIETIPLSLGSERILLVDDERMLAEMGRKMLESLGYSVTVRTSSLEALETFQNAPDRFDLVITDQTMPGLTGLELSSRMLGIRPDLPIILCTGYSSKISEETAKKTGVREFALKPVAESDIARLIRKVLAQ